MKKIIFGIIAAIFLNSAQATPWETPIQKRLREAKEYRMDLRDQYKMCIDKGGTKEECKKQVREENGL